MPSLTHKQVEKTLIRSLLVTVGLSLTSNNKYLTNHRFSSEILAYRKMNLHKIMLRTWMCRLILPRFRAGAKINDKNTVWIMTNFTHILSMSRLKRDQFRSFYRQPCWKHHFSSRLNNMEGWYLRGIPTTYVAQYHNLLPIIVRTSCPFSPLFLHFCPLIESSEGKSTLLSLSTSPIIPIDCPF